MLLEGTGFLKKLYFYLIHLHLFIKKHICLQLLSLISSKQYEEISITLSIKEFCLNMAAPLLLLFFTLAQKCGCVHCTLSQLFLFRLFLAFLAPFLADGCPGLSTINIKVWACYKGGRGPSARLVFSKRLLLSLATPAPLLSLPKAAHGRTKEKGGVCVSLGKKAPTWGQSPSEKPAVRVRP